MQLTPKALVAASALLMAIGGRAQDSSESRSADVPGMEEAFDLLDRLGTPDTSNCLFIEVQPPGRPGRWTRRTLGFLMGEDTDAFVVSLLGIELRSFRKDQGYKYGVADFDSEAPRLLQYLANGRSESRPNSNHSMFDMLPLGMRTELISIGRECARRELGELARNCCSTALGLRVSYNRGSGKGGTLPSIVKEEIEVGWMWRAILACGDPEVGREDLLSAFARCERAFPDGRFVQIAKEMRTQLEVMVQEDIRHRQESRPFETMTQPEKIEELIYRLREQNGKQLLQPGHASVFFPRDVGAASQLVGMGHAAVPRLIEAIGDRRLTRTVGYWRDFNFSHHVLRIGDAAVEILERIAGQQFYKPDGTFSYMSKDNRETDVRAAVLKWWDQIRAKAPEMQTGETRRSPR